MFPNPYVERFSYFQRINFMHLTFNARIKVYSLTGELVWEAEKNNGSDRLEWTGMRNLSGQRLASGVFIYVITNNSGERVSGKLAILR